jgi:hypothetical protein
MKNPKRDIWVYIVLLVVMIPVFFDSFTFVKLSAVLLPASASGAIIIMSVIGLARAVVKTRRLAAEAATTGATVQVKEKKKAGREARALIPYARAFAWPIGCFVCIWLIGFMPASFLLTAVYLKAHHTNWWKSIVTGLVVSVVIYVVFVFLLETPLFKGVIPEINSFIGGDRT